MTAIGALPSFTGTRARDPLPPERLGGVDGVNVSFGEPLDVEEG
jgi:hypothetical protein